MDQKELDFGSIEPTLITDDLSLQSGCDETLERMNRRYTTSEFEEVVNRIRRKFNDSILTTDIIVGFPGETDEEFNKTYEFLKKIKFYKMHIFKYSIRSGTKAEKMKNQIPYKIKEERSKKLLELSDENELQYLESYIGKKIKVLFEEKDEEGFCKGHTANYILAKVKSDKNITNEILEVKAISQENFILNCEMQQYCYENVKK